MSAEIPEGPVLVFASGLYVEPMGPPSWGQPMGPPWWGQGGTAGTGAQKRGAMLGAGQPMARQVRWAVSQS